MLIRALTIAALLATPAMANDFDDAVARMRPYCDTSHDRRDTEARVYYDECIRNQIMNVSPKDCGKTWVGRFIERCGR